MKKIFAILIAALILPSVGWAVCCTTIAEGPTAWKPELDRTGCTNLYKASYGGTGAVKTGNENLYQTNLLRISKLCQVVPGHPVALVASNTDNSLVNCNSTTTFANWVRTPGCAVARGKTVFTRYAVTTTACAKVPAVSRSADSDQVISP